MAGIKKRVEEIKRSNSLASMMKSFTLIELIIYAGIIGAILIVAATFAWQIIQGNIKAEAFREVEQNAAFAMDWIERQIHLAKGIDIVNSNFNVNLAENPGSQFSLKMDGISDPTIFDVEGGILRVKQGVAGPYHLSTSRVKITNLTFHDFSYPGTPGTIGIEMEIWHRNPAGRSEYQASVTLTTSVSLLPGD